jgi:hypothetical protein
LNAAEIILAHAAGLDQSQARVFREALRLNPGA